MKFKDLVPPILINALRNIKRGPRYFQVDDKGVKASVSAKSILSKNEELKNIHKGKRCFILATGSSIARMDLKPLKHEICIGLNEFFLHPDYAIIKPKYTIFSGFGIHNIPLENQLRWYKDYEDKIAGISLPLINSCDHNFIAENHFLSGTDKKFIAFEGNLDLIHEKGIDATKNLYAGSSVSVMALQIAIYMGFREIILVGFDHDWLLRMFDNQPTHFYSHDKSIIYKGHNGMEGISILHELRSNANLFSDYVSLKTYAEKNNIAILNATNGGMLDVFPRVQFDSLFESKPSK